MSKIAIAIASTGLILGMAIGPVTTLTKSEGATVPGVKTIYNYTPDKPKLSQRDTSAQKARPVI